MVDTHAEPDPTPVLLVDDTPANLFALESLLADLELELVTASSGADALRACLRRDFALVLLDVHMPDMDGFETAALLRANPRTRHIPIIFVTGAAREASYEFKGYEAGAVDYLAKPLVPAVVRSKVRVFQQIHRQRRALERQERELERLVEERTRELSQSEERFRLTFELAPVGVAHVAMDGTVLRANRRFCEISGCAPAVVAGRALADLCPGAAASRDGFGSLEALIAAGAGVHEERRLVRADGTEVWAQITASVVRDAASSPRYAVVVVEETTERHHMEAQLLQSQKLEALGTLAGGIAHDFNNILSAIIGYAAIAKSEATGDAAEDLAEIERAASRGSELVKQILAFSRRAPQRTSSIHVRPLVEEGLKLLRATLPTTIEIRTSLEVDGSVLGDPTQIHQILMNLCTNAALAMKPAGGVLHVSLDEVLLGQDHLPATSRDRDAVPTDSGPRWFVRLRVRDTGCGIPRAVLDRIFEPFFTTRADGSGTGLGLAVVHGITRAYGGAVAVDSVEGQGTELTVLLPRHAEGPRAAHEPTAARRGAERLLFVDDEAPLARVLSRSLGRLGYRVSTFTSSLAALEAFEAEPHAFDAVVTDMTMPGMTGDLLAKNVRQIRPDLPVVLCTGYLDGVGSDRMAAGGIGAVVLKPANVAEISAALRKLLDRAPGRNALELH
ncbi:response regulator [Myxococcota bacterium]|nr:response regulator [Myxococcota bacterium]